MTTLRAQRVLLGLFVPFTATVVALLGSWGTAHASFAYPLLAVIQLAYVSAIWRASDARLRTFFTAALIVFILGWSVLVYPLRLFSYAAGALPVAVVLTFATLAWTCVVLGDSIGADLRPNRISQIIGLAAVLGAAFIAFALKDFQQLVPFALFPIAFFALRRPEHRLVIGIAFFLGLALELYGTSVGAWAWERGLQELPTIGAGFRNPPYGAAGIYAGAMAIVLACSRFLEPGRS